LRLAGVFTLWSGICIARWVIERVLTVIGFCYKRKVFLGIRRWRVCSMTTLDVPSFRQLRAFEAVARLESVSDAAREVNLSQPALTESLHAFEARLQTRLFERRRSGCYATEPGIILLPRVRRFFDHIRSALAEPAVGAPFGGRQSSLARRRRTVPAPLGQRA
jgi:hypothetical protein